MLQLRSISATVASRSMICSRIPSKVGSLHRSQNSNFKLLGSHLRYHKRNKSEPVTNCLKNTLKLKLNDRAYLQTETSETSTPLDNHSQQIPVGLSKQINQHQGLNKPKDESQLNFFNQSRRSSVQNYYDPEVDKEVPRSPNLCTHTPVRIPMVTATLTSGLRDKLSLRRDRLPDSNQDKHLWPYQSRRSHGRPYRATLTSFHELMGPTTPHASLTVASTMHKNIALSTTDPPTYRMSFQ